MDILIFSDTHLGPRFEEKKFNFLKHRIQQADTVIINGDFWEGYLYSFDAFLNSAWKHLFPYLKKKDTLYLYGNHDKKISSTEKVNLFSNRQGDRYVHKLNGHTLIFEHGNRLMNTHDEKILRNRKVELATKAWDNAERFTTRRLGKKWTKALLSPVNMILRRRLKKELKPGEIYVCGHTHLAEFDIPRQFINSGIVRHGLAQYLVINGEKIEAKEEWYE